MSKARDMQNESVMRLREWLDFIELKKAELNGQMERLRRKEGKADSSTMFNNAPPGEEMKADAPMESDAPTPVEEEAQSQGESSTAEDDPWL